MHSDAASVRKSIRTYLMVGAALFVFTGITVAVNQIHLAVPMAITVALIIAGTKGSWGGFGDIVAAAAVEGVLELIDKALAKQQR